MTLLVFPYRQTTRTPRDGSITRDRNGLRSPIARLVSCLSSRRLDDRHDDVAGRPPSTVSPLVLSDGCARALARARSCSSALYVGCSAAMVGVHRGPHPLFLFSRHLRSHHRVLGTAQTLHGGKAGPFFSSCSRQVYAAVALDNPTSTSPPSTFVDNTRHRHDRHHGPRHGAPRQHPGQSPTQWP